MYREVLTQIEKGKLYWSNRAAIDQIENDIRFECMHFHEKESHTEPQTYKKKKGPDVVWCKEYNSGNCSSTHSHEGRFFGQLVKKLHICSTCMKKKGRKSVTGLVTALAPTK